LFRNLLQKREFHNINWEGKKMSYFSLKPGEIVKTEVTIIKTEGKSAPTATGRYEASKVYTAAIEGEKDILEIINGNVNPIENKYNIVEKLKLVKDVFAGKVQVSGGIPKEVKEEANFVANELKSALANYNKSIGEVRQIKEPKTFTVTKDGLEAKVQ
jgi:hypothetical protein